MIGWFEAWQTWWGGAEVPPDRVLWWWSIRVWGRFGILLSAAGILTLIVEIVGSKRLRSVATKLAQKFPGRDIWRELGELLKLLAGVGVVAIVGILIWSLLVYGLSLLPPAVGKFLGPVAVILLLMVGVQLVPLALMWGLGVAVTASYVIAASVLRGMAWCLEKPTLGRAIKIATAGALLIGLHFDLLSS